MIALGLIFIALAALLIVSVVNNSWLPTLQKLGFAQ